MLRNGVRVALLSLAAVSSVAACGKADPAATIDVAASRPNAATAAPTDEQQAWQEYKDQQGGEVEVESAPDGKGRDARRVLARVDHGDRIVDVAQYDGRQWRTVGEVTLPPPPFEFGGGRRGVQFGDVTKDGRTDYLIPLEATQDIAVVVSDHGDGTWRALPVRGADGVAREPYFGVEPRYDGAELVSVERLCEPTCAEGGEREVTWRFVDGTLVTTI